MTTWADYTTLTDVRTVYLGTTGTSQDAMLLALIRSVSREIESVTNRRFYPRIETRYFDTPAQWTEPLYLDDDLLSITTFTNGDGVAFTTTQYKLYPLNTSVKNKIVVLNSSTEKWQTASGDGEGAISIAGIWGYHEDYTSAWVDTGATLAAAISTTSATAFTCTTGIIHAGDLLQIESEWLYASAVTTGSSDTVTVVRAVNGSTGATHAISTALYRWNNDEIRNVATQAVVAYERLKNNPVGETVTQDGYSFSTPKDVRKYMSVALSNLGVIRVGLA